MLLEARRKDAKVVVETDKANNRTRAAPETKSHPTHRTTAQEMKSKTRKENPKARNKKQRHKKTNRGDRFEEAGDEVAPHRVCPCLRR